MLTLDLNLSSRPFKNDTLPWVGLGLAVVALTLLTIWNVRTYRQNSRWVEDLQQQYSTTREELEQLDRRERSAQKDIVGFDLEALHVRADKANEVILWKAFSWTKLFNLLQEVLPNDVQMISIRPIFRPMGTDKGRDDELRGRVPVSVEGVAKSLRAFLEFETGLIAHANFDHVEPEGHTLSRTGAQAFELKFLYAPTGVPPPGQETAPVVEAQRPEAETVQDFEARADVGAESELVEGTAVEQPDVGNLGADQPRDQPLGTQAQAATPSIPESGGTEPEAKPEPEPQINEGAAVSATTPAVEAQEQPKKRPTPPGTRRRGKRGARADDKKGGDR